MTRPADSGVRYALWAVLILALAVTGGAGMRALMRGISAAPPAPAGAPRLPAYGRVPDFVLTERSGQPLKAGDLRGRVWIADFIYTRCGDTCPLLGALMARLQADLADAPDLRLVSFSVDPAWDTPQVLRAYAARFGADPARWLFVTGDAGAMRRLVAEGFRLPVEGPNPGAPGPLERAFPPEERRGARWFDLGLGVRPAFAHGGPAVPAIAHSSRIVLVDRVGRIRAYEDSGDPVTPRRLQERARALLAEDGL
jgi:protein SCO1/2